MFRRSLAPRNVKVLCLSFTARGSSVGAALRHIGMNSYDLVSVFDNKNGRQHPQQWAGVLKNRKQLDFKMFDGYDAIVGLPATGAYKRVLGQLPEYTKVILVEETDPTWWKACYLKSVVPMNATLKAMSGKSKIAASWHAMLSEMFPKAATVAPDGTAEGDEADHAMLGVEEMERVVRDEVPAHRLLIFRHGDGWEPLCQFLERDVVPTEPFPAVDDGEADYSKLVERMAFAFKISKGLSLFITVGVIFVTLPTVKRLFDEREAVAAEAQYALEGLSPAGAAAGRTAAASMGVAPAVKVPGPSEAAAAAAPVRPAFMAMDENSSKA
jgi:hypothetical protein